MPQKYEFLYRTLGIALVILVGVFYPRLCLLGGFPGMDEGSYAFISQISWQNLMNGDAPPAMYGLSAYPLLLCWVYALPGMPWVWFRLLDLLAAAGAGFFLCRILCRESKNLFFGLAASLAVLCCLNCGAVIDAGYKNSMPIAMLFLFWALDLGRPNAQKKELFLCGVFVALAVLFREPFFVFAILGFFSIWLGYGFRAALVYMAGGLVTALCLFTVFHFLQSEKGGLSAYAAGYLERGFLYSVNSERIWRNFSNNAWQSILHFGGVCLMGLCSLVFLPTMALRLYWKRLLFWSMCMVLPLLEPLTKLGFIYHFAVCLPGVAGFCAAVRGVSGKGPGKKFRAILTASVCAGCLLGLSILPDPARAAMTLDVLKNFQNRMWPAGYTASAVPLLAVEEILRDAQPGATLGASGFSFYLYYISGLLPPREGWFDPADSYRLADLSRSFALMDRDVNRLAAALANNPPDIIAVGIPASEHEADFHDEILSAIARTGLYRQTGNVAANPDIYYGWIGYRIYKLKNNN